MSGSLENWSNLVQVIALPLALLGLWLAWSQVRKAANTAHAELILAIDATLESHLSIREQIRQGWQPKSPGDRNAVRRYVGVFERVGILLKLGEVQLGTVDQLYGDRVAKLLNNDGARAVVTDDPEACRDFVFLWRQLRSVRNNHRNLPEPPPLGDGGGTTDKKLPPSRSLQLAIAGIAVAGGISVIVAEGAWTWWDVLLGTTLLLLLHAFDVPDEADAAINVGFAAVWSLAALVAIGLLINLIERVVNRDIDGLFAVLFWLLSTAMWIFFGPRLRPGMRNKLSRLPTVLTGRRRW
jgi:hypothetical protein